jgi:hypothetical protein
MAISEDGELHEEEIEALADVPETRVKKNTPTNISFHNSLMKWFKK